ncbi:VIT1/CCC1 transporter family protein [Lactiplantibacillus fabifermentans]|nr:VIT1/CCC1 transporter family protein [Lactiplantibacillus fabifermentans]KRO28522.1 hypothetical protein DY78_GL002298 [Lactiplantibacillus fabifermentans DSM 21115]
MKRIAISKISRVRFWDSLNVLRAGILGANDGIISVSGIVLGAAGADMNNTTLFFSGLAGMIAGACSMAGGEYISVSAQRDVQRQKLAQQQSETKLDEETSYTLIKAIDVLNPLHASISSFCAFICGAVIPLMAISLSTDRWRIINTVAAMIVALTLNAVISSLHSNVSTTRTILRNICVGVLTTILTYAIGTLFGVATAG